MSKIRTIFSILTSVPSGSALHSLSLSLHPPFSLKSGTTSYHVDHHGLLDLLVGADMLKVLDGFPSLSQLSFELHESDEDYDVVWWKEEMMHRLPSHLHAVTIKLHMETWNYTLWLTEEEITTRCTHGGARRNILDAGGYTSCQVDFDLKSEKLGESGCSEPHVKLPLSTNPAL
ncbi:hypothetical protein C8Q74DRAFT_413259 [Fomes fomentarius]|nr:hypothetical protein C8Q74DRAFT_413259 [Fomes fomentarius]